jgi:hypothetical protein
LDPRNAVKAGREREGSDRLTEQDIPQRHFAAEPGTHVIPERQHMGTDLSDRS